MKYCPKCGEALNEQARFCDYCGCPAPTGDQMINSTPSKIRSHGTKFNALAITGFVISCISLLLNFWGIVGIAGTIVSVIGVIKCGENGERGKALAIVGIVIGVISIIYAWVIIASLSFLF